MFLITCRCAFFYSFTRFVIVLLTLKCTFLCAGMVIGSPVCGLRPSLSLILIVANVPNSRIDTFSPAAMASEMLSNVDFTMFSTSFFFKSGLAACILFINSDFETESIGWPSFYVFSNVLLL